MYLFLSAGPHGGAVQPCAQRPLGSAPTCSNVPRKANAAASAAEGSTMTREAAISSALAYYDDRPKGYFADLARWVAVPTESQNPERVGVLGDYLETVIRPELEALGYTIKIYPNPLAGCGPVLLATRIEDASLPTFIAYGHGDVVLGMEGRWANDRD